MIRMGLTMRMLGAALMLALGLSPAAYAFQPFGGYDPFQVLRMMRWPLGEIDTNNDGDVTRGEGLELFIEGGPSGFTAEEIEIIKESFTVWEDVSTSYIAFRVAGIFQDHIFPVAGGLGDGISTIQMNVPFGDGEGTVPDPADIFVPEVSFPVLGVALILFTPVDIVLEHTTNGSSNFVGAGTILDADILIDAVSHRNVQGLQPLVELKATMVHELGHILGLGHTPLNNLRADFVTSNIVENDVFWHTGADGVQRRIGVTPTMFPFAFAVRDSETGVVRDGGSDLAPDDMSAVSFLYPRQGAAAKFFNIKQEVRNKVRANSGMPSVPLLGSHVVAWADTDNDPNTPHVPIFSTTTGLFEFPSFLELKGRFEMVNLWKQFEMPNNQSATFAPTYIFTQNPLNFTGFERQAPPGLFSDEFDTISRPGGFSAVQRQTDEYVNAFFSEVFNEFGNIIDITNREGGTRFVWSFERNKLVSLESDRTLDSILSAGQPMFGDSIGVCPFNFLADDFGTGTGALPDFPLVGSVGFTQLSGPDKLRAIRDNFLLRSGLGTAAVTVWYQAAPAITQYLVANAWALTIFKGAVIAMYLMLAYWQIVLAVILTILFLLARKVASLRKARAAATGLLFFIAILAASPAHARILYQPLPDFVDASSAIVVAKVDSTNAMQHPRRGIVTEVLLTVTERIKGDINVDSPVTFTVTGGTYEGLVQAVSELPTFKEGEEIILHLRETTPGNFVVYGGLLSKSLILTNQNTGQKTVQGAYTNVFLSEKRAKSGATSAGIDFAEEAPLVEYVSFIREIVREQKKTPHQPGTPPTEDYHECDGSHQHE